MAWRLGAKTRVLALGAAVGLCLYQSKGSLLEWIRTAQPECHVLFNPGGYTAELQPADISIQQPLKHSITQQAMQFFDESVCRDDAVLDLRLGTMKRLMAHWVLHACAEVQKTRASQRKPGATSLGTLEEAPRHAARATHEHLNGTLFDETVVEQEEPPEEEDLIFHDEDSCCRSIYSCCRSI